MSSDISILIIITYPKEYPKHESGSSPISGSKQIFQKPISVTSPFITPPKCLISPQAAPCVAIIRFVLVSSTSCALLFYENEEKTMENE